MALLDVLINAAKKNPDIDDVAIREEVDTFVFEVNIIIVCNTIAINNPFLIKKGHDTTAMGVCFTILLLAEHKQIQVKSFFSIALTF